jgi:tripartite-type tricarboxylate transporter receptor subunit TctC
MNRSSISRIALAGWLAAAAALLAAPAASAQGAAGYPNKPLKIVVTFTTGGAPTSWRA